MKDLLNSIPDVDAYLDHCGISEKFLNMLGIKKSDLKTVKDLTDLAQIMLALKGNPKSKQYVDESNLKETQRDNLNNKID